MSRRKPPSTGETARSLERSSPSTTQGANGAWFTPAYSLGQGLTLPTGFGIGDGVSFADPSCDAAVRAGGTCTIEYHHSLYDLRTYTEPSVLAGVTTAGDIQLYLTADFELTYADGSEDGNAASFDTAFTLTYHYVPEPGSAALLALGLAVATGAPLRRRRSRPPGPCRWRRGASCSPSLAARCGTARRLRARFAPRWKTAPTPSDRVPRRRGNVVDRKVDRR